ncbi:MAG: DNA alkylation repair protein [Phycisphaerales bacterium]|nr:MAG: DNA alkylation repair protein [Phycisphaerales bacterium]
MEEMIRFIQTRFRRHADPARAQWTKAYLKTDMPAYGLRKEHREVIHREFQERFEITSRAQYRRAIETFWSMSHREHKHFAIWLACTWDKYITIASVPLYERMIRQGAWWDLVDGLAIDAVGLVVLNEPEKMNAKTERWIDDPHLWIRRTAIICRIGHKDRTDRRILFNHCLRRAHEKEFFIRKAIGWALRADAKTAPDAVRKFLIANRDKLSGLSLREAGKHLDIK